MEPVFPVAGVGMRREVSSLHNICDSCSKAGIDGRRLKMAIEQLEKMPKKSLQETERLLKKHGPSPPFLACKALALVRLDPSNLKSRRTAQDLLDIIPVRPDLDELTVLCIIHFYQHSIADYTALHEFLQKLVAVNRTNSDMLDLIWLTYFRHHNFKDMQKAVMDLAKVDVGSADKHFVIGVVGLVMQALDGLDTNKRRIMLTLAYRTLDKRFPKVHFTSDEAVLKLWLLSEIGDLDGCLTLLNTASHGQVINVVLEGVRQFAILRQICRLLASAGRLDEAESHLLAMKHGNLVRDYIDVSADIFAQRMLQTVVPQDDRHAVSVKLNTVMEMMDAALPGQIIPVTVMSHLQLLQRLSKETLFDCVQTALVTEIGRYFEVTGDRACFFTDIHQFLLLLDTSSMKELLNRLSIPEYASSRDVSNSPPEFQTISEVIRHQNFLTLQFYMRKMDLSYQNNEWMEDSLSVLTSVKSLLALRVHVTELECLSTLQSPDMVKLGDAYATLACYTLFDSFQGHPAEKIALTGPFAGIRRSKEWKTLMDMMVLLECTMTKTKPFCNPSLRILLIHLYLRCGAVRQAYDHFCQMDVKSLQFNHLSFLLTSAMAVTGVADTAMDLLTTMIRFYTGAIFDCFDFQLQCVTREKHDYFSMVQLEQLKRDFKYSMSAVYANYMRLWILPARRQVVDVEVRAWMTDTTRYLGASPLRILKDFSDRGVIPSLDIAFDRNEYVRNEQMQKEELAWLSVLTCQMALYSDCFSLASTYARYNPFDTSPFPQQLLDHIPAGQISHLSDGVLNVRRTSDSLFEACKTADETLPNGWRYRGRFQEVGHLTESWFPHPLPVYLTMGCHALLLRIAQMTAAFEVFLSTAVQEHGGTSAYPVLDAVVEPSNSDFDEDAPQANGTAKKPFSVILRSLEISLKLQQMIYDVFTKFDDSDSTSVYRYRDLILGVSLICQVVRSSVWIIQCLRNSVINLATNNDKRKDARGKHPPEAAECRVLLEECFLGFALCLEDLQNPVAVAVERIQVEVEKLSSSTYLDEVTSCDTGRMNYLDFALCSDEPDAEKRVEIAARIRQEITEGWKSSLSQVGAVLLECHTNLAQYAAEARSKLKSKGGTGGAV